MQWELAGVILFGVKYLHHGWVALHSAMLGACLCILHFFDVLGLQSEFLEVQKMFAAAKITQGPESW